MSEKESNLVLNLIEEKIKTLDGYKEILSEITDDKLKFYVTQLKGAVDADDWVSYEIWTTNILSELEGNVVKNSDGYASFGR